MKVISNRLLTNQVVTDVIRLHFRAISVIAGCRGGVILWINPHDTDFKTLELDEKVEA